MTFETVGGTPTDLLQAKHHRKGSASLTDASPDLWKTLRIWFEGHASGQIPPTANLYLVTTSAAPVGTAASRLRLTSRDLAAAQHALDATAVTSTNLMNKSAYAAYLKAAPAERTAILGKVSIVTRKGPGGQMRVIREPIPEMPLELKQIIEEMK